MIIIILIITIIIVIIITMMMLPVIIAISTKLNTATIITNHNDNNNNNNKNDHIIIIIIILQIDIHDCNYISVCHTCNIITSFFLKATTKKNNDYRIGCSTSINFEKKNDLEEKEIEWLINYMYTKDTIT